MKQPRVLVCGGRDFARRDYLFDFLDSMHADKPFSVLICGMYRGADTLAAEWAKSRGVPLEPYPADWDKHGKAAGPIRNQQMLDEGKPTIVFAFDGHNGTDDMIRRAKEADIPGMRLSNFNADSGDPETVDYWYTNATADAGEGEG